MSRTAFSCTWYPKRKLPNPQAVTLARKRLYVGRRTILHIGNYWSDLNKRLLGTIWETNVTTNVIPEVTSGSTAKEESPTSPLVKLTTALSFLISNPTKGAAGFYFSSRFWDRECTLNCNAISERIQRPEIRSPICMTETSLKRKKSFKHNFHLS